MTDQQQQLVTRPGWEWLADDPFPHWRRWADGACVWESHGEWVVHLDDDDSPDHEAATAVEAMAWADHEQQLAERALLAALEFNDHAIARHVERLDCHVHTNTQRWHEFSQALLEWRRSKGIPAPYPEHGLPATAAEAGPRPAAPTPSTDTPHPEDHAPGTDLAARAGSRDAHTPRTAGDRGVEGTHVRSCTEHATGGALVDGEPTAELHELAHMLSDVEEASFVAICTCGWRSEWWHDDDHAADAQLQHAVDALRAGVPWGGVPS